jgi:hypothetical protein
MKVALRLSTIRAFYLCFKAAEDILEVKKMIDKVKETVIKWAKHEKNNKSRDITLPTTHISVSSADLLCG